MSRDSASVLMYRLGGQDYPLRAVAGCKTCESRHRFEVERQIAAGRTYASIARDVLVEDPDSDLLARNIRDHFDNGHMPLDVAARRMIVDQRAEEIGADLEQGVRSIVDQVTLLRTVVQRTFEEIAAGRQTPEVSDGIAAARALHQIGADDGDVDQSAWVEAFMIYHETLQAMIPPELFERFGRRLAANPVLASLQERYSQRHQIEQSSKDS